jgi:mercuric ion transport protein
VILDFVVRYGPYPTPVQKPGLESASLFTGVLSATGASVCCSLPFALVSLGVAGAWMSQLRALERFFPVFVLLALAAFSFAFYRLYLRPAQCAPGEACAVPDPRRGQRIGFWVTLVVAKILIIFPFVYARIAA